MSVERVLLQMLYPRPLVPFRTGFFILQLRSAGYAASSRLARLLGWVSRAFDSPIGPDAVRHSASVYQLGSDSGVDDTHGRAMFKESLPIAYDAPADLKKWPSLNNQRLNGRPPYLVYNGTLADCIKLLLAKPIKQISLYDIVTEPQPIFERPVLSPADAAEIAMRKDFPKG
jgi:hypothetical protein